MKTESKSKKLLIATLMRCEASGNVESGLSRTVKAYLRQLERAKTPTQRQKVLGKLSHRLAKALLRKDLIERQ
jgi:hypothetical protein